MLASNPLIVDDLPPTRTPGFHPYATALADICRSARNLPLHPNITFETMYVLWIVIDKLCERAYIYLGLGYTLSSRYKPYQVDLRHVWRAIQINDVTP